MTTGVSTSNRSLDANPVLQTRDSSQNADNHTLLEDIQGMVFGVAMLALSMVLLQSAGLITGQIAGLSLLFARIFHLPFGLAFFVLNAPFYAFALLKRGWSFTLRTILSVTALSLVMQYLPSQLQIREINPWVAAIFAGFASGIGLISLFRHGASAGGAGILAIYIQERTGFRAGWFQMAFDACVFALGAFVLRPEILTASALGAIILNMAIALNHRKDRYVGVSN
jgi:uncharacterized membrane-anchored protein YitT (DUF2179 family)